MIRRILDRIGFHLHFEGRREEYPNTFRKELSYQCGRVLTFACLVTFSFLAYIPLDRELHPGEPGILILRVLFPLLGVTILILRLLDYFRERSLALLTVYGAYLMVSTAVLTGLTGGDPAYMGGFTFLLTLTAVAPIHRRHAYLILFTALAVFFAVGWAKGIRFDTSRSRYSLNDLMAATLVISCFIYIMDGIRYRSWKKSKTIEQGREMITRQKNQLEEQISMAGELQKKLLPEKLPGVRNASIVFSYLPMMGVGGDFVDINYSQDRRGLGLFICDVSGHGVAAAFISSMVKMSLGSWREHLDSPSEMLRVLHDSLKGKMGAQFVTAAICYLDLETGLLRLAGAGHPPVIVVRAGGGIELFKPPGRLINDLFPMNFADVETVLEKNDKIVLYTDGVTECFNADGAMFGDEALHDMVMDNRGLSPADLCAEVMRGLTRFAGEGAFEDDITILVTEYLKGEA
ncbi:MAG: serine/threonine-protein phosphatase [Spirochaetes bacterium]|nr:serine/threonine-protein phosphatase [Spirochaetota bacterium]